LPSDFLQRKEEVKQKVLNIYSEISRAKEGNELAGLKEKARGILKVLETATTRPMLDRVETGILSLENDLNRAAMNYR